MSDLIDRQAAITAVQKAYADTEGGDDKCAVWNNIGLTNALHIMQDLPSAQQWILTSERPPDEGQEVFVYLFDRPSPYIAWMGNGKWCTDEFEVDDWEKPVAWMPLPEPYGAVEQEDRR